MGGRSANPFREKRQQAGDPRVVIMTVSEIGIHMMESSVRGAFLLGAGVLVANHVVLAQPVDAIDPTLAWNGSQPVAVSDVNPDVDDSGADRSIRGEMSSTWFGEPRNGLRVRGQAAFWLPSLGGDMRFGGGGDSLVEVARTFGLDDNEPTFKGELDFTWSDEDGKLSPWRFSLDLFDFDTEATGPAILDFSFAGTAVPAGTLLQNDYGLTNIGAHVGYDFKGDFLADQSDLEFRMYPVAGFRALNIDHRLAVLGGGPSFDYDKWNAAVEAGGRINLHFMPEPLDGDTVDVDIKLLVGTGFSGDADLFTINVEAAITYMPWENFGVTFGYRQLDFNLDDSGSSPDYEFDGRVAGVIFAAVFKF
jgi:hypothetical protein